MKFNITVEDKTGVFTVYLIQEPLLKIEVTNAKPEFTIKLLEESR